MNTANFEAFVKVIETGSVSIAADKLCLTQPAVSKRIQQVEEHFGMTLFEPMGRGVRATQAAMQLYPKLKAWLISLDDMQKEISLLQDKIAGKLKIGTSHHIGLHYLPEHLKSYTQKYEEVSLEVSFMDSEQAHEQILSGEIDLAFLTLPPELDGRLKYQALWHDPLCFVAAPFHPLSQLKHIQLKDLMPFQAILPASHTFTSQITLSAFEKEGLKPKTDMRNNSLESIRMLVSIGLGWSLLPLTLCHDDLVVLDVESVQLKRQLGLVYHPERCMSKACQALIDQMQDVK
ncbi:MULTISPECIES: LysR family transcriptional regulator [unclassified Acinetobacter]|uniref:LysR family transcriptional regulator n=1 Tax=unclassified Acinetobacter TaxID=196816 RepID=UPI0035B87982